MHKATNAKNQINYELDTVFYEIIRTLLQYKNVLLLYIIHRKNNSNKNNKTNIHLLRSGFKKEKK